MQSPDTLPIDVVESRDAQTEPFEIPTQLDVIQQQNVEILEQLSAILGFIDMVAKVAGPMIPGGAPVKPW